jgi:hypothetical protein
MAEIEIEPDREWYCPLLLRMVAEGYCLDINYQRIGLFMPDVLTEAMQETRRSIDEINAICMGCPNQPLSPEDYNALLVGNRPVH